LNADQTYLLKDKAAVLASAKTLSGLKSKLSSQSSNESVDESIDTS